MFPDWNPFLLFPFPQPRWHSQHLIWHSTLRGQSLVSFSLLQSALPYAARSIPRNHSLIISLICLKPCLFPVPLTLSDQTYLPRFPKASASLWSSDGCSWKAFLLIYVNPQPLCLKSPHLLPLNSNSNIHSCIHHILVNYCVWAC